jgi:polyphosphate kinase 2 (PPK2 family)
VLEILVTLLKNKVEKRKKGIKFNRNIPSAELPHFKTAPSLSKVDTSLSLQKDEYREKLFSRQKRIHELHNELYRLRIPMVIVYEGWDAAGKGGNIRRLTEEMDPRGYEVIPIAAPNENDWKQAYREINEMEENFHNYGTALVKFWVHIDKDEQLKRFEARKENPAKLWKLHEEDWRNREKWNLYEKAAEEMFLRTHTPFAPWTIIEGNCKRHARIKALDVVIEAIEKKIDEKR